MTLLVILGAGASRDCVDERHALDQSMPQSQLAWRPPVVNELFEPRPTFGGILQRYRPLLPLVVELRRKLGKGGALEPELDKVQARAESGDEVSAVQLMALRFYLREVLSACSTEWPQAAFHATNYHWLVERLDRWARAQNQRVLYVTFNYDTLLEDAIGDVLQHRISDLGRYTSHPRAKVIKPHGSSSWGRKVFHPPPFKLDEKTFVISHAGDLDPGPIEFRSDWSSGIQGTAWVPALAVPIESKLAFECPDTHLAALEAELPDVDRILVIGWRATEKPYLDLMERCADGARAVVATALACANREHEEASLERVLAGRQFRGLEPGPTGLGFSELVGDDALETLLRSET